MEIKNLINNVKERAKQFRPLQKSNPTRHPGSKKKTSKTKRRAAAKRARTSRKRNR